MRLDTLSEQSPVDVESSAGKIKQQLMFSSFMNKSGVNLTQKLLPALIRYSMNQGFKTEIIAAEMTMLDSKRDNGPSAQQQQVNSQFGEPGYQPAPSISG